MATPNAGIPYVPEDTLDPAAGLNLALNVIDALLQIGVIDMDLTAPPGSPVDGALHIVAAGATGAWAGEDNNLARYVAEGTFWQFYEAGTQVKYLLNQADGGFYKYDSGWVLAAGLSDAPSDGTTYGRKDGLWEPISAGGGASVGVQYTADTGSTADSDPGAGLLKWNNATQASATFLYLDDETADAVSLTTWWAALEAGGFCYLQHATDQDTWQIWEVTAVTDASGYVKLAVTLLANGGSFADADPMLVTLEQGATASGMTNPMTTAGDIIVGGVGGAPGRLGIGSEGDVLTIVGGALAYAAPAGGAMTFVAEGTVVGAAVTTVNISGLDLAADSSYYIQYKIVNATGSVLEVHMHYNSDTTSANYRYQYQIASSATTSAGRASNASIINMAASSAEVGTITISTDVGGLPRAFKTGNRDAFASVSTQTTSHIWNSTANVTSIDFTSTVANAIGIGSNFRIFKIS